MLFDVEHLQKLAYDRSTKWSNFMENMTKKETSSEEIVVFEMDNTSATECDDSDELASMEDDECDDVAVDSEVLRNITNTARMSLVLNDKASVRPDNNRSEEEHELIDTFNKTLPIIHEYNRQLEEFGLDKILKSFDRKQIEEKVGGWLNRHNSLYTGDNSILYGGAINEGHKKGTKSTTNDGHLSGKYNDTVVALDSEDSLQSGETARYIRSSRIGTIKRTASTTTMIKTHKVKTNREALRGKYPCDADDSHHHLKVIRHRKKVSSDQYYDITKLYKSHKYEITPLAKQRRKVLRKRTCSISCNADSSSDSDYCYEDNRRSHRKRLAYSSHHCSAAKYNNYPQSLAATSAFKTLTNKHSFMKIPSARMDRIYYYSHSLTKSFSTSSSSSSFSSVTGKLRKIKRNMGILCNDNRPWKRESECQCCDEKKLCGEYKHVADMSTGEWKVENCCPPKKLPKKLLSSTKIVNEDLKPKIKSNENNRKLIKQTSAERKPNISETKTKIAKITSDVTESYKSVASAGKKRETENEILKSNIKSRETSLKTKNRTSKIKTTLKNESSNEHVSAVSKKITKSAKSEASKTKTTLKNESSNEHVSAVSKKITKSAKSEASKTKTTLINESSNENFSGDEKLPSITKTVDNNLKNKSKSKRNNKLMNEMSDKSKTETSKTETTLQDDISDLELQMALEASKKSYEDEQRRLNKEMMQKKDNNKMAQKEVIKKTVKKKRKNKEDVSEPTQNTHQKIKTKNKYVAIEDDEVTKKRSKLSGEENNEVKILNSITDNERKSDTIKMSTMKNRNCTTNTNDESLFTMTQAICNSTALSTKSKAFNRQIFDQLVEEEDEMSQNENVIDLKKLARIKTKKKASEVKKSSKTKVFADDKAAACSTVTSTTIRSPYVNVKLASKQFEINELKQNDEISCDDHSDCAFVTSTTNIALTFAKTSNGNLEKTQQHTTTSNLNNKQLTQEEDILIYKPEIRNMVPANSFASDGSFTVTKDHLSSFVGKHLAEKFLKYYIGRRRFDSNATVYFKPPIETTTGYKSENSISDSADDLDYLGQYGDIYSITK